NSLIKIVDSRMNVHFINTFHEFHNALRFSQGISQKHAGTIMRLIFQYPILHLLLQLGFRQPIINRKAKSAFCDKFMTFDRFKRDVQMIVFHFIIASKYHHKTLILQSYLSRSNDMSSRMKTDLHPIYTSGLIVIQGFDLYIGSESML